jgi:hypothetical protein
VVDCGHRQVSGWVRCVMDENENYRCGQTRTETNERTEPNGGRACPLGVHRCRIGYENRRGRAGISDLADQVPPWVPRGLGG